MVVVVASLASGVVLHELIHMVSARLIGVESVRLRLVAHMGAIDRLFVDDSPPVPRGCSCTAALKHHNVSYDSLWDD